MSKPTTTLDRLADLVREAKHGHRPLGSLQAICRCGDDYPCMAATLASAIAELEPVLREWQRTMSTVPTYRSPGVSAATESLLAALSKES